MDVCNIKGYDLDSEPSIYIYIFIIFAKSMFNSDSFLWPLASLDIVSPVCGPVLQCRYVDTVDSL